MQTLAPDKPKDRFEVYRFFNGMTVEEDAQDASPQHRRPSVKSFLLEHVNPCQRERHRSSLEIFEELGEGIQPIDETFLSITSETADPKTKKISRQTVGFLEPFDSRFFAYYTCEESTQAKQRVGKWALSRDLDHTWFSSPFLQELWDRDVSQRGDHLFGKLSFQHESIFDMPGNNAPEDEESAIDSGNSEDIGEKETNGEGLPEFERRNARFDMKDRIGAIRKSLEQLQSNYDPLYAISALRLPSRVTRGGHDLYQNGQLTHNTDSFEEHRNTLRYLYRIYKSVLEDTEDSAWARMDKTGIFGASTSGAPLIVRFSEPLSEATFDRWIRMAFQKRNRFKLWGNPIKLGPTKVHVYGADRHLWQPINLEITEKGLVAILPQGTCGNTFHRLVANVQRYVSPNIEAWIGARSFSEVVGRFPVEQESANES